ncbi:10777_t:CDS:2 [Dentiscutata erythropus]|uniref:10777_t:CDS:1 n=1 Tax=Dentiscutata erythropus TaxID=1348616 RepID=A0A9N9BTJ6_9GLOM|nr:10777_t:CDS:2 [Dentiscutata erythropus]
MASTLALFPASEIELQENFMRRIKVLLGDVPRGNWKKNELDLSLSTTSWNMVFANFDPSMIKY